MSSLNVNTTINTLRDAGLRVFIYHRYPGKHSKKQRHNSLYYTEVNICRPNGDKMVVVSSGEAKCSSKDVPSRKLGASIALGRALLGLPANLSVKQEE